MKKIFIGIILCALAFVCYTVISNTHKNNENTISESTIEMINKAKDKYYSSISLIDEAIASEDADVRNDKLGEFIYISSRSFYKICDLTMMECKNVEVVKMTNPIINEIAKKQLDALSYLVDGTEFPINSCLGIISEEMKTLHILGDMLECLALESYHKTFKGYHFN